MLDLRAVEDGAAGIERMDFPAGLLASSEPYIPDVGMLYWLEEILLADGDPKDRRPCLVIAAPKDLFGTVMVVTRSTSDRRGVFHDRCPEVGLAKVGFFSQLLPVQCQLWTPDNARSIVEVDNETFAYVLKEFDA